MDTTKMSVKQMQDYLFGLKTAEEIKAEIQAETAAYLKLFYKQLYEDILGTEEQRKARNEKGAERKARKAMMAKREADLAERKKCDNLTALLDVLSSL